MALKLMMIIPNGDGFMQLFQFELGAVEWGNKIHFGDKNEFSELKAI